MDFNTVFYWKKPLVSLALINFYRNYYLQLYNLPTSYWSRVKQIKIKKCFDEQLSSNFFRQNGRKLGNELISFGTKQRRRIINIWLLWPSSLSSSYCFISIVDTFVRNHSSTHVFMVIEHHLVSTSLCKTIQRLPELWI